MGRDGEWGRGGYCHNGEGDLCCGATNEAVLSVTTHLLHTWNMNCWCYTKLSYLILHLALARLVRVASTLTFVDLAVVFAGSVFSVGLSKFDAGRNKCLMLSSERTSVFSGTGSGNATVESVAIGSPTQSCAWNMGNCVNRYHNTKDLSSLVAPRCTKSCAISIIQ